MPEGDEEKVAGAHRIEVIPGVGEIVCEDDGGGAGGAEGAGGGVTCHIYDPIERGLILFPSEHRS